MPAGRGWQTSWQSRERGLDAGLADRLPNPAVPVHGEGGELKLGTTSSDHDGEGSGARA